MNNVAATISRKADAMVREVNNATRPAVTAAALVVTNANRAALNAVAPGGRLRNVGTKGAKLSAGFDVKGQGRVVALGQARGPWQLIERDTRPHSIEPRSRRGFKAVNTPEGPRARVANHPGTTGKHPFARSTDAAIPTATPIVQRMVSTAVIRGFRS